MEATRAPARVSPSYLRLGILLLIFFVVSLLTNIIGPLVPDVIRSFHLSLTMAAFLPFSFFVAYAVMSIPSGILVERWGEKPVLLAAFFLAFAGSLLFCLSPMYRTAILSLFLIGLGMAALQVAINPLLRVAGGEENFAFNSVLAQLVFGLASFVSPLIYSYFAVNLADGRGAGSGLWLTRWLAGRVPAGLPWIAVYWVFAAVALGMVLMIFAVPFPQVARNEDERVGAWATHLELARMPTVWLFFLGVFFYVGLEQGLSNWMSQFLAVRHGLDPQVDGAQAVSRFWGLMTVGCGLGLVLLKFFDSRRVLLGFSFLACLTLAASLFGPREVAVVGFPVTGFAISVMWSIIFSLALNSLPRHHGTFSGILCTGIVGGALFPLFIGNVGDHVGLTGGLCLLYLPLLYIFSMGFWARPLVNNKTVSGS